MILRLWTWTELSSAASEHPRVDRPRECNRQIRGPLPSPAAGSDEVRRIRRQPQVVSGEGTTRAPPRQKVDER